jgi:hypothetical protein
MESFTVLWNQVMSFGVFALMLGCLVLIYALVRPRSAFGRDVSAFVTAHILWLGFAVSTLSVFASLVYSSVIGFAPCLLCWYARISIYPQAIIYGLAAYKKDTSVLDYTLALSAFGIIVSGYHTYIENVGYSALPCTTEAVSCLARPVLEYGFITIPVMALAGAVALFLLTLVAKRGLKTSADLTQ